MSRVEPALKVGDIRPDSAMAGQEAALDADIAWLAARRDRFVAVACPACGGTDGIELYEKFSMTHRRCAACHTQFVSPRPDAGLLSEFYVQSRNYAYWAEHVFPASKEARRERIFRPRAELAADIVRSAGIASPVLLEVGAAYGLFCDEAAKTGVFARIIAVEPTPDLAEICRQSGLDVIEAGYADADPGTSADLVAAFEVIEHLFDPGGFLRWCHDRLNPGGYILLTCPNIAGFETMLLGRSSNAVDHEHLNMFTPASLAGLAARVGFVECDVSTPGELDVEIVRRALEDGTLPRPSQDPVLLRLIEEGEDALLQAAVRSAGLSSNMRLTARKAH